MFISFKKRQVTLLPLLKVIRTNLNIMFDLGAELALGQNRQFWKEIMSGAVFTWGKGDYHRLGHGTDDHVRRPKKVQALQGKKVVSIATGSLHCVACTTESTSSVASQTASTSAPGDVFTWGDNEHCQLGQGNLNWILIASSVASWITSLITSVIASFIASLVASLVVT